MVHHSSGCRHTDRCDHAPGMAQAVVPEQADTLPGAQRRVRRSSASRVHLSPLSRSAGSAIGDSWLPGLGTPGVGRDIPGHPFRSQRRRVARLPGKGMKMAKPFQFLLLAVGVIALLAVGGEIIYSIAATTHGSTAARVVQVQAGPYPLTVSLYTYPAHASYALPFAIAPQQSIKGTLTYEVSSIPDPSDVPATPVRASLSPDSNVRNGVQ